ncbi:hypothetical protein IE53DRAFT_383790 [Violaceomyces palustris]|uniref:Uncharacterized protein n=1 Tax=Violaceomyces palustris TaxID=1673888 RepID=A0ACD0P6C1_9BASI|nr:hypothetical protein IE53DRAFT_383790 [Violaceomyces palustris]
MRPLKRLIALGIHAQTLFLILPAVDSLCITIRRENGEWKVDDLEMCPQNPSRAPPKFFKSLTPTLFSNSGCLSPFLYHHRPPFPLPLKDITLSPIPPSTSKTSICNAPRLRGNKSLSSFLKKKKVRSFSPLERGRGMPIY